jgi:hypothetical protein
MNQSIWAQEPSRYDKEFKYFDGKIRVTALTKQVADEKIIDLGEYFHAQEKA